MIWKATEHTAREVRVRKKLAILPTLLDNGYWIWMDWYWAREEWDLIHHDWREVRTAFSREFVR